MTTHNPSRPARRAARATARDPPCLDITTRTPNPHPPVSAAPPRRCNERSRVEKVCSSVKALCSPPMILHCTKLLALVRIFANITILRRTITAFPDEECDERYKPEAWTARFDGERQSPRSSAKRER